MKKNVNDIDDNDAVGAGDDDDQGLNLAANC